MTIRDVNHFLAAAQIRLGTDPGNDENFVKTHEKQ